MRYESGFESRLAKFASKSDQLAPTRKACATAGLAITIVPLRRLQDEVREIVARKKISGFPVTDRKTGKLVAMAMVKSVRQLASTLVVAA